MDFILKIYNLHNRNNLSLGTTNMKHFQKYILFILLAAVPAQFLGTEQSKETLLKKFKEKSLAVGKIGLGGGGVIMASFLMVALLAKPFVDLLNLRNDRNDHICEQNNHCCECNNRDSRVRLRFCCCGTLHTSMFQTNKQDVRNRCPINGWFHSNGQRKL